MSAHSFSSMSAALDEARKAASMQECPIGAVITRGDEIIARAHNLCEARGSFLAHAEILVIEEACRISATPYLTGCTLFVTLEPCALCAAAVSMARLDKLVFGAYDPKGGAVVHGARLFEHMLHKPEVIGGIEESACAALLTQFFKTLRIHA